jgi:hypothetical protein
MKTRTIRFDKFIFPLIAVCLVSGWSLAFADTIKNDMPACVSEEYFDELSSYTSLKDDDLKGVSRLYLAGKCLTLRVGESVTVISPGFMRATVRYKGVKLFTYAEALR